MKKKAVIALILGATFSVGAVAGVAAESTIKDITAQINYAIKFKLNGNDYTPLDSDGNTLNPIIYNGNSYLPVRAVGQAFGVAVDWDDATQTIILGEREGKGHKLYDFNNGNPSKVTISKDADILSMHGEKIDEGFYSTSLNDFMPSTINFKIDKKYQKLTFKVGVIGEAGAIVIIDYKTNVELKRVSIEEADKLKEIEVDGLAGVEVLQFKLYGDRNYNTKKIVVADAYLK